LVEGAIALKGTWGLSTPLLPRASPRPPWEKDGLQFPS
jgi:hypothetical protein